MAGFDFVDMARKAFLAGVGAVAVGAERSQELVDELIAKGELTVEQGKALNAELTRKVKETADESQEALLRAHLRTMSAEERAAWVARAQQVASDLDAETVEVPVEEVVAEPADAAEDAPSDEA